MELGWTVAGPTLLTIVLHAENSAEQAQLLGVPEAQALVAWLSVCTWLGCTAREVTRRECECQGDKLVCCSTLGITSV